MMVSPNMIAYGAFAHLVGDKVQIAFTVTNNGDAATTVTHLIGFHYKSWFAQRIRRKPDQSLVAQHPQFADLPSVLAPGEQWRGMTEQTDELVTLSNNGRLYLGVLVSTSKKAHLSRVVIHAASGDSFLNSRTDRGPDNA